MGDLSNVRFEGLSNAPENVNRRREFYLRDLAERMVASAAKSDSLPGAIRREYVFLKDGDKSVVEAQIMRDEDQGNQEVLSKEE